MKKNLVALLMFELYEPGLFENWRGKKLFCFTTEVVITLVSVVTCPVTSDLFVLCLYSF